MSLLAPAPAAGAVKLEGMFPKMPSCAVAGLAVVSFATGCTAGTRWASGEFDGVRWRNADPSDSQDQTRCDMVESARDRVTTGMDVDEVVTLLGMARTPSESGRLVYLVGACNSYGVDLDELWVVIGDGVVTSTRIVQG